MSFELVVLALDLFVYYFVYFGDIVLLIKSDINGFGFGYLVIQIYKFDKMIWKWKPA